MLLLAIFWSHVEQQTPVVFVDATQQPAEHGQKTRFFARSASGDLIRRPAFRQIGSSGSFFTVIEQLIERYLQGSGHLLEGLDGGNGMAVLDAGDIAPEESGTFLDIALREPFLRAERADDHR